MCFCSQNATDHWLPCSTHWSCRVTIHSAREIRHMKGFILVRDLAVLLPDVYSMAIALPIICHFAFRSPTNLLCFTFNLRRWALIFTSPDSGLCFGPGWRMDQMRSAILVRSDPRAE